MDFCIKSGDFLRPWPPPEELEVLRGSWSFWQERDLIWVVVSNNFLFSPLFGEDEPILTKKNSKGLVQPPIR